MKKRVMKKLNINSLNLYKKSDKKLLNKKGQ